MWEGRETARQNAGMYESRDHHIKARNIHFEVGRDESDELHLSPHTNLNIVTNKTRIIIVPFVTE